MLIYAMLVLPMLWLVFAGLFGNHRKPASPVQAVGRG
jgi:hypothetical protein